MNISALKNRNNVASVGNKREWIYLMIASAFEVVFALSTNASQGFTQLLPSFLTIISSFFGILFLSKALVKLDIGIGYTVWVGIGSLGTVVLGAFIFDEAITIGKVICFMLIIGGVIGMKLSDSAALKSALKSV